MAIAVANFSTLNLIAVNFDDPAFATITRLTNINRIYVNSSQGMDGLIARLAPMPGVVEFILDATGLSPDSIKRLPVVFLNLRKLRCTWVVDAERERLMRTTLPGVEIEIEAD